MPEPPEPPELPHPQDLPEKRRLTCLIEAIAPALGLHLDAETLAAAIETKLAELVEATPPHVSVPGQPFVLPGLTVTLPPERDTASIGRAIALEIHRLLVAGPVGSLS